MRRTRWLDDPGDLSGPAQAGALLRERRERRGLGVGQVAAALRCAEQSVVAVEEGRFQDLPPRPYSRGLIGAYASLVGIDPEALLRACPPGGQAAGRPLREIFPRPDTERFNWRNWTVPLLFAAALTCFFILRLALSPPPTPLATPPELPAPPPATELTGPFVEEEVPAPVQPAPQDAPAPGVKVLLRSEGATWIEAALDGGKPKRQDLGPGQSLDLEARERIRLNLGDAGVLRLRVNGRELGFVGDKGETRVGLSFRSPQAAAVAAPPQPVGD